MSLDKFLNARSVAVVGASRNETKRGYQAIKTLIKEKFEGDIYPINPNEESILGFKCYKQILDVEKDKIPDWLDYHLHVVNSKIYTNNKIYIAKRHLTLDGLSHKDGGGVFPKFKPPLQLTAQGEKARSHWSLPKWLIEGAWECRDGHLPFLSGGRQQEFVFDLPDKNIPKLIAWLKELLEDC